MTFLTVLRSRIHLFISLALGLATLAGGVYAALTPANSLMNWYSMDDAFYYYKVAQNVITGNGFTFDGINLTNGFHPLWMLVCLCVFGLSEMDLILPLRVLVVVSALFNCLSCILLYRFLKDHLHPAAALLSSAFLGLSPFFYEISIVSGMESAISRFFIILFLLRSVCYHLRPDGKPGANQELFWLGVIGVFTIFARLDNVFLVAVIGLTLLLRIKKIPGQLVLDVLAFLFSAFLAWAIRLGGYDVLMRTYSIYPMLLVAVLIKPGVLFFCGLYTNNNRSRFGKVLWIGLAGIFSIILETLILFLLYKLNITLMFSLSLVLLDCAISLFFIFLLHRIGRVSEVGNPIKPFKVMVGWVRMNMKRVLTGGLIFAAPIGLFLGAYMLFNQLTFGTFMPISGQVKSWWGSLPNVIYAQPKDLLAVLGLNPDGPWGGLTLPLYRIAAQLGGQFSTQLVNGIFLFLIVLSGFLVYLGMKAQKGRAAQKAVDLLLPSAFLGAAFHITKYTATSYAGARDWYWIGETVILVVLASLILDGFFRCLDRPSVKMKLSWVFTCILMVVLIVHHGRYINRLAPATVLAGQEEAYLAEVRELEFFTDPGTKIGMTGSGFMGYFITDRTVVNLDGLINSVAYFKSVKSGTGGEFLAQLGLDYVYGKPYTLLESDPYNSIFEGRVAPVGFIRGVENFTLYKYLPD